MKKPRIKLERVNYFDGQFLSAADLQADQDYHLARQQLHNRFMHGWGVISGLSVKEANSSEIIIEPGVAIDCFGHEIYVDTSSRLTVPSFPNVQFVVIQYIESKTLPILPGLSAGHLVTNEPVFTRIRESFRIEIIDSDPTADHKGKGVGTAGCGYIHPLCIARLRKNAKGWSVVSRGRRHA